MSLLVIDTVWNKALPCSCTKAETGECSLFIFIKLNKPRNYLIYGSLYKL